MDNLNLELFKSDVSKTRTDEEKQLTTTDEIYSTTPCMFIILGQKDFKKMDLWREHGQEKWKDMLLIIDFNN